MPVLLRPSEIMSSFSAPQRSTLESLCRRIIPAAFEHSDPSFDLPALVEARLVAGDSDLRGKFATLLTVFGSRSCTFVFTGRLARFENLPTDIQDKTLRRWELSAIGIRRTIFQAFRKVILSTYYASPESHAAIGFRGPLYLREAMVAWEGALPGIVTDSEPVARTTAGDARSMHAAIAIAAAAEAEAGNKAPGITQGHEISADVNITADVCVIGTGAGGAVAAARLAEAGYDVVILEEGGYWRENDFTEQEFDMVPRLYADRGTRATDDLAISLLQGRSVGGGTLINWMIMLRTADWVLDEWAREHGTEGMSSQEMRLLYDQVEEEVHARTVPDDAHAPNNRVIMDGATRAGWKSSTAKINARGCVRAGFCGLGCRYGAKQSTLVTYIPRALAAGARLYSDVRVETVTVVERGSPTPRKKVSCTVIDRETHAARHQLTVHAPLVVLAGGAIGTPAILQRSGLGGGAVGKYLRLHPTTAVIGKFSREMYGTAGIPQSALSDHFIRENGDYGFWIECPGLLPGLAGAAISGFGASHRAMMESFPNLSSLIVLTRDGSERGKSNGDVTIGRGGRTHIRYALSGSDGKTVSQGIAAAARIHFEAGATEVTTLHTPEILLKSPGDIASVGRAAVGANQLGLFSAHVNGTCRIGGNPGDSGCSPDGERYGAPGVYVADGSLFPTAPGVNPQATIMALATLVAQRIIARHPLSGLTTQGSFVVPASAPRS